MSKKVLFVLSLLVVAAMVLAACAPAATTAPTEAPAVEEPAATEAPVVEEPVATEAPAVEEPVATEAPTEVATEEVSAGAVTIKIWHAWKTNEQNSLKEVLAAFKAANPDIGFSVLYVPFDDLRSKFETATATGGGPDVLIGAADWGPAFYDAALVADLTGLVSEETLAPINPAALAAVQYKDALVGLPETIKGVVSFRNTTIMADAPTSLQDLLDKATAATQGDVVGADIEYGPFFSMANLTGCNGTLMDAAGQPTFNNEAGVCWLNIYLAGQAAGIPGEYYTDNDVNLFKAGKVGYIIDGTWNTSALAEAIGAENLAIDPWPTTDLNHMSGYVQTENIYLNANSEVNSPEAAAAATKFIEFFLSPEAQKLLADPTKAAHLPAITGVEITDPLMSQMVTAFEGGTAFPVIPQMNAYWDPMGKALQTVLNEGVDPATALQTAYDEVMAKLAEMGG